MKKNILYISMAVYLVIISLAGCNKDDPDISSTSSQLQEESTAETVEFSTTETIPENTTEAVPENTTGTIPESTTEVDSSITLEQIKSMPATTILSEEDLQLLDASELFYSSKITDEIFQRINGISFGEDCTTSRDDLRYLRLLYTDLDGVTHIGELICNKAISDDLLDIFEELYKNNYPIEKMVLVDEYEGDDNASMADNNTSCFNFRAVPGQTHLSQHAYGRAIDINPLYNPYIDSDGKCLPENGEKYVNRDTENPYKIDEDDLCYQLFMEHGFTWGGSWNTMKDYQHFQKKEE